MKFSLLSSLVAAQLASAHYTWDVWVAQDGTESKPLEFIRENTRQAKYNPTKWKNPLDDMTPDVTDFRCNKGSFASASRTKVVEVKAGDKVAMKLAYGAKMEHPGPGFVAMSKAPSDVTKYEGDGDWFFIHQEGICNPGGDIKKDAWCTWGKDRLSFQIPEGTPKGEYLVRTQHVGLHGAHDGQAEFYYSCAQVRVTEGGNGTPGPTIKLPSYKKDDPAWNFSVWGGFKEYTMPYPPVWSGGSSGGNSTGSDAPDAPAASPSAPAAASPSQPADSPSQPADSAAQSPAPASDYSDDYPSQPAASPAQTPQPAQQNNPFPGSGFPKPPTGGAAGAHNAENCNGGKKSKRGRRAFRNSLRN